MQAFGEYSDDGTASAMKARDYKDATDLVASPVIIDRAAFNQGQNAQYKPRIEHGETMDSLVARGPHAVLFENHPNDSRVTGPHDVAPSCVSRYGTGGGNVPLVQESMAFQQNTRDEVRYINGDGAIAGALAAETGAKQQNYIHIQQSNEAIAFEPGIATREGSESRFVKELSPTLRKEMGDNQVAVAVDVYNQAIDGNTAATLTSACGGTNTSGPKAMQSMAVRRLTPRECERLQGFPDDHTLIPWRNKPADQCPDGPRYKALGNSMAVPCMAWIGKRIDAVERNMK
jgi:DNA (cytosine-5)-methyltransferase 1